MKIKALYITLLLLGSSFFSEAQVAWLSPENPSTKDTVVLTYDSNAGNGDLAGYTGTVYLHTGVITEKSIDGGDWKHVTGNWGEDDANVKMQAAGNGLYQFTFVIDDYYQLREEEVAQQLAFVFRNQDGSKVGKTSNNEDIYVSVNGYQPPVEIKPTYLFTSRKYLSDSITETGLIIKTDKGWVQLITYTPKIIEIKHFDKDKITTDSSDAVILKPVAVFTELKKAENQITFSTDSLTIIIHKDPFYLSYSYHNETILEEDKGFFKRTDNDGLQFKIDRQENFYGLGERAVDFSLKGNRYNLYNRPKYGYGMPALNLNYSIPLLISSKKYLLYFDNPQKGYADIGFENESKLEWGAIGGLMKYFVVPGYDYYDIMEQWGILTGTQPMPPRWVLGNLQSRMAYRTQMETDSIVSLMQQKNFPIDAIILDFYWFGDSIQGTMGRLEWYRPNWPAPEVMINDFKEKGVKTILITEPYILDSLKNFAIADELGILAKDSLGQSYINYGFYFGFGALIDIFNPIARQWFWEQYQIQINKGVAGWWGDLGEPENHPSDIFHVSGKADEVHNLYAHYWHKMLYDNYRKYYPYVRLFNLNRAGFAGSQRYSIYPWTGDVSRSWSGLEAQVPIFLHMSMSGLPFIHSDAGGFAQGTKDEELYTRWVQMACLSPVLRPHGSVIPSEPVYFDEKTQNIVRDFMHLRYRLLPYIYTTATKAHLSGYPIIRPLFFDNPDDSTLYSISDEYMFGPNMLVCPVVEPGINTMEIYLPEGGWYNFWNDEKITGHRWISQATQIENIPVYIKEGSFIPLVEPVNSTDDYSSRELTIRYYPGQIGDSSFYIMFEDDGSTFGTIERGEFELLKMSGQVNGNSIQFGLIKDGWEYSGMPRARNIKLELIGLKKDTKYLITLNGQKLKNKMNESEDAWFYINDDDRLTVAFRWSGSPVNVLISEK